MIAQNLNCRITRRQGLGLRRLFDGLVAAGEGVRWGSSDRTDAVKDQPDALRWLLDKIADAAGVS